MKRLLLSVLISLLFVTFTIAGGFYVYENSIVINGKQNIVPFLAGEQITIEFTYDNFMYGGKPYAYAVFKLYKLKGQNLSLPNYFIMALKKGDKKRGMVTIYLDEPQQDFVIKYHVVPFFSNSVMTSDTYFLSDKNINIIKEFYKSDNNPYEVELIKLSTLSNVEPPSDDDEVFLYFQNPSQIKKDLDENRALTFSWYNGPGSTGKARNTTYSYRLDPIEEWSIYSNTKSATYYFLRPGVYSFQVKAKYWVDEKMLESNVATYDITVIKQIFQVKDEIGLQQAQKMPVDYLKNEQYNKSKALLIGITDYSDPNFPSLPFVKQDIKIVGEKLKKDFNFEITLLITNTNKAHIVTALQDFLNNAEKNDRIILYFSGHGTSIGEAGFLVPSDGVSSNKVQTCISFEYLTDWINKLITQKKIKHLLIILDSCQAGLGVYSKSDSESPIVEISKYDGAHMMTAGLLNQKAIAENDNSIFTKFLVKGMSELGDYNRDDVVTLSELLVYVQNNVSNYAKTRYGVTQTPMLGKIKGVGEMMFILNLTNKN